MGGDQSRQIERAVAHFTAARRLQNGMRKHGAMRGLAANLRHHVEIVGAISQELGNGARRGDVASEAA